MDAYSVTNSFSNNAVNVSIILVILIKNKWFIIFSVCAQYVQYHSNILNRQDLLMFLKVINYVFIRSKLE